MLFLNLMMYVCSTGVLDCTVLNFFYFMFLPFRRASQMIFLLLKSKCCRFCTVFQFGKQNKMLEISDEPKSLRLLLNVELKLHGKQT